MTCLILIRHGETDWNVQGRWQGHADVPLNARGRAQARALAAALDSRPIAAIYASDLARSRETARMLASVTGSPLILDFRLREIDQGEWQGLLVSEIEARYTELFEKRLSNPLDVAAPGGETAAQVQGRMREALGDIRRAHPDSLVAIISHGFALGLLLADLHGRPLSEAYDWMPANGGWVEIEVH